MIREPESQFLNSLLQSSDRVEARSWLADPEAKNNLGELSVAESRGIVNLLYEFGAVEVSVVRISIVDGYGSSDNLIIGMYDNVDSREKIFGWLNELAERIGVAPLADNGQRYVLAWFG